MRELGVLWNIALENVLFGVGGRPLSQFSSTVILASIILFCKGLFV